MVVILLSQENITSNLNIWTFLTLHNKINMRYKKSKYPNPYINLYVVNNYYISLINQFTVDNLEKYLKIGL